MASSRKASMTGMSALGSGGGAGSGASGGGMGGSGNHNMAAPNARVPLLKQQSSSRDGMKHHSTVYLEALKVLSEDTMSKACELLLSDRDYRNMGGGSSTSTNDAAGHDNDDDHDDGASVATTTTAATRNSTTHPLDDVFSGKSDLEQLRDLYKTCCKAAKVIEKEAATLKSAKNLPILPAPPAARSSSLHLPSSSSALHASVGSSVASATSGTGSGGSTATSASMTIPNRRLTGRMSAAAAVVMSGSATTASATGSNSTNINKRGLHLDSAKEQHVKRARATSPVPPFGANIDSTGSSGTSTRTTPLPPPSARQFLAKLNDKTEKASHSTTGSSSSKTKASKEEATSGSESSPSKTKAIKTKATTTPSPKSGKAISTSAKSAPSLPQPPPQPPASTTSPGATRTQPPRASRK